jgi:hypothetical protein
LSISAILPDKFKISLFVLIGLDSVVAIFVSKLSIIIDMCLPPLVDRIEEKIVVKFKSSQDVDSLYFYYAGHEKAAKLIFLYHSDLFYVFIYFVNNLFILCIDCFDIFVKENNLICFIQYIIIF